MNFADMVCLRYSFCHIIMFYALFTFTFTSSARTLFINRMLPKTQFITHVQPFAMQFSAILSLSKLPSLGTCRRSARPPVDFDSKHAMPSRQRRVAVFLPLENCGGDLAGASRWRSFGKICFVALVPLPECFLENRITPRSFTSKF